MKKTRDMAEAENLAQAIANQTGECSHIGYDLMHGIFFVFSEHEPLPGMATHMTGLCKTPVRLCTCRK